MNQRITTILALCAAIVGAVLSLYQGISSVINLAQMNVPPLHLVLQFLASNDWVGYGLIFLFAMILFLPRVQRLGAVGVIIGALIRLFFSVKSLISILMAESALQVLGNFKYVFILSPVWALTTLVFGILWAANPQGRAVRVSALVVGAGIAINMVMGLLLDSLTILNVLVPGLLALWFFRLFFQGHSDSALS